MSFSVFGGTDLFGSKVNKRMDFPRCPTMSEFINAVESQYDVELRASRPAGYPDMPFKVQTFQLYDEVLQRWVDLYSSAQLTNGCTVYCFQPESIWHSDAQGIIPDAAKDTVTWTTPVGSPRRQRIAQDAGVAPTLSEKLRSVFYDCDTGNKGYVLYSDLRAAFQKCDIEFTLNSVGDLFTAADLNRSGHITYDEWVNFAIKFPQVIDALFFRSRDVKMEGGQQAAADEAARAARQAELREMYERRQWTAPAAQPPAPGPGASADVQELAKHMAQQRSVAAAAVSLQADMQLATDEKARSVATEQQRLMEIENEIAKQEDTCVAVTRAIAEAEARVAAAQQAAISESRREGQLATQLEEGRAQAEVARRQAEVEQARRAAAEEVARSQVVRDAQARAGAEAEAAAASRAQSDYEQARRDADAARMQKEQAESRERQAWDKLYYSPQSPHYGASPSPQRP